MAIPPSRPLLAVECDFTTGPPNTPGASRMSLGASSRRNVVRKIDTQRGRQYELDQIQAGTCTLDVLDPLDLLNPANATSPYMTSGNKITSYRAMQVGWWWNTATASLAGNITNATNKIPGQPALGWAYGYDPTCENWYVHTGITSGTTLTPVSSPADGTHPVTQVTVATTGDIVAWSPRYIPGRTYTVQVDVNAAAGVVVQLAWNGATPATTTITGNGAYQTMTLGFVPGNADTGANVNLGVPSGAHPATFYCANILLFGPQPGWTSTGSITTSYSGAVVHSGAYAIAVSNPTVNNTLSLPLTTAPGVTYTFSAYVLAQAAGTVATMTIGASSTSTTSVGAFQRLALTFVATDAISTVTFSATGTSYPAVYYIDDYMLEIAASASAFTSSGPTWYPLFTGYVERYPLSYDMSGTRAVRPLAAVDALSVLARTEINQSYQATILADTPSAYMPLNDQALPQTVNLYLGGNPFVGYTSSGTNGQVSFGGDSFLDGTPTVSVSQQNATPPTTGNPAYITYLGTSNGAIPMNPQSFTFECWVKVTTGTPYLGAASVTPTENPNGEAAGPNYFFGWYTNAGRLTFTYTDPNGGASGVFVPVTGWNGYPDNQWHYLALCAVGGNSFQRHTDTSVGAVVSYGFTASPFVLINNFFVDATTYFGGGITTIAVANVATYPTALSTTQVANHYQRGIGYQGELPGARVTRLLNQYWAGAFTAATGERALAPDYTYNSRFVLDVIQEIQETERGLLYADRSGAVVFEDSVSRYGSQVALWVLGENPAGASPVEYSYTEYVADYDPTYVFSQTNLTRPGNSAFAPQINATAAAAYGQRILTQQVQVNSDFDLTQASIYYLARYAAPAIRIETLTLNPGANPALWPLVLTLEISQRITVKRRSPTLTTSADYYIEQISHSIDTQASTWIVRLQCSPVANPVAWVLGDAAYGVLGTKTVPVY